MKSKASFAITGLIASLAIAGCATITKGTTQQIAVNTPGVPGAECTLNSGGISTKVVTTPATLIVDKSQDNIAVTCRKACYQDAVGIIPSHTEAMAAGNVIAGGLIGLGVDAASGAMNRYNSDNQFALIALPGCKAPIGAPPIVTSSIAPVGTPHAAPTARQAPNLAPSAYQKQR